MSEKDCVKRGLLIVGSGPSGVGKGTVHAYLRQVMPSLHYSVSVTTRQPRPGEREGVDYFFRTVSEFQQMIGAGELLEYANVFGNYYGTPRKYVTDLLAAGKDVLLEIDVQGALQIKHSLPEAVLVFIAPPDMEELARRLRGRGTDAPETVERRLRDATGELAVRDKYDYVVVNDTVEQTVQEYLNIIAKEREK